MNYDTATDAEINEAVACYAIDKVWLPYIINGAVKNPDYCNSPADMWPICEEHGISIIKIQGRNFMACSDVSFETICMSPDGTDNGVMCFYSPIEVHNKIAWRAAAIVYLKMMEAGK